MYLRTMECLMKAFAGESQARNRYIFYASAARKEGYVQISRIFEETAANEKEHAERFYKLMVQIGAQTSVAISADFPVALATTRENLGFAARGENEEWTQLYPEFARIAAAEGCADAAQAFERIAAVEKHHEARYLKLADTLDKGLIFTRQEPVDWICLNCGYIHTGTGAPDLCPACLHPKAYYAINSDPA